MKLGKRKQKKLNQAIDRGRRLLVSGRHQETLDFLEKAVRQFPGDAELQLLYATTLLMFRPDEAVPETAKAVQLAPEDPSILVRAARLMFDRRNLEAARAYALRARELAGPDFVMLAPLANVEGRLAAFDKNYDQAEEKFRLAVELNPTDHTLVIDLASLLASRGQRAVALEVIDQAIPRSQGKDHLERLRKELAATS